jgi:hypothetical protein
VRKVERKEKRKRNSKRRREISMRKIEVKE